MKLAKKTIMPIPNILLIYGKNEKFSSLKYELKSIQAKIFTTNSIKNISKLLKIHDFAIIVFLTKNINSNILKIYNSIKKNKERPSIIFIIAENEKNKQNVKIERNKIIDYLFKPIDPVILRSKISVSLDHYFYKKEIEKLKSNLKKTQNQLKNSKQKKLYLKNYDRITNLPTREKFKKNLSKIISSIKKENKCFSLLFIDINQFSQINDALGHDVGDLLLKQVANRLQSCIRSSFTTNRLATCDSVTRLGSDEFIIITAGLNRDRQVSEIAQRIIKKLNENYELVGHTVNITINIGIAFYPNSGKTANDLIKKAIIAMRHSKELGVNNFQFFKDNFNKEHNVYMKLENYLLKKIKNKNLKLYYRSIYALPSKKLSGIETRLEWEHPEFGIIPGEKLISISEATNTTNTILKYLISIICKQYTKWGKMCSKNIMFSINISAFKFFPKNIEKILSSSLKKYHLSPNSFELILTEEIIMTDLKQSKKILGSLSKLGCKIAIAKFGTGYSSIKELKNLPIDKLVIDESFLNGLSKKSRNLRIINSIFALANNLKLIVSADGISTKNQLKILLDQACPFASGHYFGNILNTSDMTKLIENARALARSDKRR